MSLNGIDTASYQAGLDPAIIPMDFNIVKATQGTDYINPDYARMAGATVKAGKLLGIYHYAAGGDPEKEADFFLKIITGYIGRAILCLDWEGTQNPAFGKSDVEWCKRFCDRVRDKTGISCFVYMSKSVCRACDWTPVAKIYPLWCAQYANMERTGYQTSPWTDGKSFGAWGKPLIYQYSSAGRLSGWGGRLDLDIAYLTRDEWIDRAAGMRKVVKLEAPFPDRTDEELAVEVLFGRHGGGDARRKQLGSRYTAVQGLVNYYAEDAISMLEAIRKYGRKYGGGLFADN